MWLHVWLAHEIVPRIDSQMWVFHLCDWHRDLNKASNFDWIVWDLELDPKNSMRSGTFGQQLQDATIDTRRTQPSKCFFICQCFSGHKSLLLSASWVLSNFFNLTTNGLASDILQSVSFPHKDLKYQGLSLHHGTYISHHLLDHLTKQLVLWLLHAVRI